MNILLSILLMGQPAAGQEPNPFMTWGPLILIIVVFYFFMIRPQVKRQKEMKKFRSALSEGDKIVTVGGIYGKILKVEDKTVIIEVENQGKLKVDKSAITQDASGVMGQK